MWFKSISRLKTYNPQELTSNLDGFENLLDLYYGILKDKPKEVVLILDKWIHGNLCSPLGAIFRLIQSNTDITITFSNRVGNKVNAFLSKNNFLNIFCGTKLQEDKFSTIIAYNEFHKDDTGTTFEEYLVHSKGFNNLPTMSKALSKEFKKSLAEINNNALVHSDTETVFSCGQYFRKHNELLFTITDIGVGFQSKVNTELGKNYSAEEAISWAMAENNTTRKRSDNIPGGLGLKLIKSFLRLNQGSINIVSGDCYWLWSKGKETSYKLSRPFPGTAVTIKVLTNDKNKYLLGVEKESSLF